MFQSKGIYSMITTFIFIMVLLLSVLGFMWLGAKIKTEKGVMNDALIKYNMMMDGKNRILSNDCYGQVVDENAADTPCDFPPGTIKGYVIEMLKYQNCSNITVTWTHMFSSEDGDEYPYFIPIRDNDTGNICPGKLKVIA